MKNKYLRTILIAGSMLAIVGVISLIILTNKQPNTPLPVEGEQTILNYLVQNNNESKEKMLDEYLSEKTIGFAHDNGEKVVYIFSSPISYYSGNSMKLIDLGIKEVEIENKKFYTAYGNDVLPYYPTTMTPDSEILIKGEKGFNINLPVDKKIKSEIVYRNNFINESAQMIVYKNPFYFDSDLCFYPNMLGTSCEIYVNEDVNNSAVSFFIDVIDPKLTVQKDGEGYLRIINENNEMLGIVQSPIMRDEEGKLILNGMFTVTSENNTKYKVDLMFPDNSIKKGSSIYISYELRKPKQPDSQIYSKQPTLNTVFSNKSIIGYEPQIFGEGKTYTRLEGLKLLNLDANKIYSADYHFYNFSNTNMLLKVNKLEERWCSLTTNWQTAVREGKDITTATLEKTHEATVDITEHVKEALEDQSGKALENGIVFSTPETNYCVLSSSDNSLFLNCLKLTISS